MGNQQASKCLSYSEIQEAIIWITLKASTTIPEMGVHYKRSVVEMERHIISA
jgi:hypothetical protein